VGKSPRATLSLRSGLEGKPSCFCSAGFRGEYLPLREPAKAATWLVKGESARVIVRSRNREVGASTTRLHAANKVWIPGGTFLMGSDHFYPEERPAHRATVDGFWMDKHLVTNAEFRRFIEATAYTTVAERGPNPADYEQGLLQVRGAGTDRTDRTDTTDRLTLREKLAKRFHIEPSGAEFRQVGCSAGIFPHFFGIARRTSGPRNR